MSCIYYHGHLWKTVTIKGLARDLSCNERDTYLISRTPMILACIDSYLSVSVINVYELCEQQCLKNLNRNCACHKLQGQSSVSESFEITFRFLLSDLNEIPLGL